MICVEVRELLDRNSSTWTVAECGAALKHIRGCQGCRNLIETAAALESETLPAAEIDRAREAGHRTFERVMADPEALP